ncbi:MAG: hypothetical protein IM526_02275 [Microcystis sp. M38BS1]|uniref:hypothetical protein n=1 Tax=Microcystis sp. M38BS1 TaxID=2771188 RepID=UPI0031FE3F20|nr:hypothetical protein [Microcystis sp. M38BS1]MCA6582479.1 hypothetical protein [Pseudanabaena sp. M34BS1SP1A06MG]
MPEHLLHDLDALIKHHQNLPKGHQDKALILNRNLLESFFHGTFIYHIDWRDLGLLSYESHCYLVNVKDKEVFRDAALYLLVNV